MLFFDTEFVLYLNIGGSVCVCVCGWVGGHGKRNMQWINMVGIFIISDTPYHECNTIFSREIHAGFHVFVITGYHKVLQMELVILWELFMSITMRL